MNANNFVADYEIIRTLMHAVLRFGTITPEQIDISQSKYNKMKPLLMAAMQDHIEDRRYRKGAPRSLHITADTFSQGLSALCNTYMFKSVKQSELGIRLIVLQLLYEKNCMTGNELVDSVSLIYADADSRTILRQCRHLAEYGQINIRTEQNRTVYAAAGELFKEFGNEKTTKLIDTVSFSRQIYAPSVCGEQLYHSLCDLSMHTDESHFLVTGINIGYVLDDAVLYDLLQAIEERKIVSIKYVDQYHGHPDYSHILPLRIHSCEAIGRRYLVALDLNDAEKLILCRLDFIRDVIISKKHSDMAEETINGILQKAFRHSVSGAHLPNGAPVQVRLRYNKTFEPVLCRQFPDVKLLSDGDRHIAVLTVNHSLELKAFLRENAESVQPEPDDSNTLYEEMKRETALWRARYGIES